MDVTDTHQPRTQSFTSDLARPPPPTKLKGVKDYEFGIDVYKKSNYKNLYEYTIIYNHTDTLLLAESMMVYRKVILDNFQMVI